MSTTPPPAPSDDDPEFGPGGYLPERAAKRARKIVLRAQMGMHWIWGAVAVGVGVLVVGVIFLLTAGGPPGAPYVELGPTATLTEGHIADLASDPDGGVEYLSTLAGRIRLFHVEDADWPIAWCEASRRLEGVRGVWSPTGRGLGVDSLAEHPTVIVDDILYWDPTTLIAGPIAEAESPAEERGC